jgi:hypothetical protein
MQCVFCQEAASCVTSLRGQVHSLLLAAASTFPLFTLITEIFGSTGICGLCLMHSSTLQGVLPCHLWRCFSISAHIVDTTRGGSCGKGCGCKLWCYLVGQAHMAKRNGFTERREPSRFWIISVVMVDDSDASIISLVMPLSPWQWQLHCMFVHCSSFSVWWSFQ